MTIEFANPIPLAGKRLSALPRLRIGALILLRGLVRPTELSKTVSRSVLDLPIDNEHSLLSHWMAAASELCSAYGRECIPVRLLLDRSASKPLSPPMMPNVAFFLENDPFDFRGTGGVLRDLCAQYDENDFLLAANAAQILFSPLSQIVSTLASPGADIATIAHQDGSPATVMLIRCGSLMDLPDVGYVDMKEQALSRLAKSHRVHVCTMDQQVVCSIRTGESYIHALRAVHADNLATSPGPLEEYWQSLFEIAETGATLGSKVRLHDSVVLNGATVGAGAVLVRSVIGPGAVVPADAIVVDSLVSSGGTHPLGEVT